MITKSEIIDTAKNIISEKYDVIKEKITDDISFRDRLLKFDILDKHELLMAMEEHYEIFISSKDAVKFEHSKTLNEFCGLFFNFLNTNVSKIKTKDDVFQHVKSYLSKKYDIMNAKTTDNFFIDLHFSDIDRSEIIQWADETFNIKLPRTYFLNLDDFCDNILKCLPKKDIVVKPQNKIQKFIAQIIQRIK